MNQDCRSKKKLPYLKLYSNILMRLQVITVAYIFIVNSIYLLLASGRLYFGKISDY